jgi:hypothetical protein
MQPRSQVSSCVSPVSSHQSIHSSIPRRHMFEVFPLQPWSNQLCVSQGSRHVATEDMAVANTMVVIASWKATPALSLAEPSDPILFVNIVCIIFSVNSPLLPALGEFLVLAEEVVDELDDRDPEKRRNRLSGSYKRRLPPVQYRINPTCYYEIEKYMEGSNCEMETSTPRPSTPNQQACGTGDRGNPHPRRIVPHDFTVAGIEHRDG